MTDTDIARHVDAAAVLIGLPIGPEYRAGVLRYFGIACSMATLVGGLPLTALDEPAEAFVPVAPPEKGLP